MSKDEGQMGNGYPGFNPSPLKEKARLRRASSKKPGKQIQSQ